jgi:oligopeptide/dipeptide ABC transporter ATP-binding protein
MASKIVVMYAGQVAEQGPTEEIIRRPRHPYTQGLISCIESLEARERPAGSIPGVVPAPLEFNQGCRFASRCERASDDCLQRPPEARDQGGGSLVACYHPLEVVPA